ncbi:UvrD-helicase domain-containing protein [Trueperella bialowiezensis]|uniref:Helicase IV n=1 Tax=Trueperella bialowiezensis TaxID=312285 RepID=A0A448PCB1_9ACTO|nr:UvrD-helicase domain-containing protein [Trueperella bialowiezensis]VEI12615.1 Helicase IV [Trueperella bialowiezensis]
MTQDNSAIERAIAEEQVFVSTAYRALDAQRDYYTEQLARVRAQGGTGTPGAVSERDSFATHYEDNLIRLRNVENRLVMGRLDHTDGEVTHIGRMTLRGEDTSILLTDWRAPQSEPFYQATAAHPGDIVRRRHIQTRFREVTGIEDELLVSDAADSSDLNLIGEGALMAAMSGAREGKMGDIVATIQTEQDRIIRADSAGILVVQGGPGTGKTAVALHRAAYLLYTHRERLSRSGVLIIGPSPVFLRYIDQVLPSLGESDVVSTTIDQLVPGVVVGAQESAEVAQIKGRPIWATFAKRAVRKIVQKPLKEPVSFKINGTRVTLTPDMVDDAQRRARRSGKPHNQAREVYARHLVNLLAGQLATQMKTTVEESDWLIADVAGSIDARREINLRWLPTSAQGLLERIYHWPELLERIAPELTARERELLRRERGSALTSADVPIIDELAELLGPFASDSDKRERAARVEEQRQLGNYVAQTMDAMDLGGGIVTSQMMTERISDRPSSQTLAERASADRSWTYGHVVVDEAQELSPMQWRMIARRNPAKSMTIVGDLDQRPAGAPQGGWDEALGALADFHRVDQLTISYRTPASVLNVAREVMLRAGYNVGQMRAARDLPSAYRVTQGGTNELVDLVVRAAKEQDAEFGIGHGSIGVITSRSLHTKVGDLLAAAPDLTSWTLDRTGSEISARIHVLTAGMAKGLEYDVVVLVEPASVLRDGPGDLYVAMTRPTRRLDVLYQDQLPAGM